jgi:hypothetical protein
MTEGDNSFRDDDDDPPKEGCLDKGKRMTSNCCNAMGLQCFKFKEQAIISKLEYQISRRQKKFGIDYLTLVNDRGSQPALRECLKEAIDDIAKFREEVDEHDDNIDVKEEKTNRAIKPSPGGPPPEKKEEAQLQSAKKKPKPKPVAQQDEGEDEGEEDDAEDEAPKPKRPVATKKKRKKTTPKPKTPKPVAHSVTSKMPDVVDEYSDADPSKWKLSNLNFAGATSYESIGKQEQIKGDIAKGIEKFKANPSKYLAMTYQTAMLEWPKNQHTYTYVHRAGTKFYKPKGLSSSGWVTLLLHEYQRLPPFKDNILPPQYRDKYTDNMTHCKKKLHSKNNKPILPGRGMGIGDEPNLKIIGDVDPSDINQGSVGDCWLLSGISSLAEFDGAVKRLFRKTKNLDKMPFDDGPNMYTITLWDLATWKEVDINVDERLCTIPNGNGQLLGAKPSEDGELWVCILEKALAAHCGGWDKITGGQCTHAWALMTGCKQQYTIRKNETTGKYECLLKYDPYKKKWAKHANSPHDGDKNMWRSAWPQVGGGGDMEKEFDEEELFLKLCAWDGVNYIIGAGTSGTSDKHSTGGMVDNHAYSVITCVNDVAGTGIDLIKVRNPWGQGEIEDGYFDDDGPGWDEYPQIKKALNPVVADDGIFWVTKQEFFKIYQTIYLSASNMTEFLED